MVLFPSGEARIEVEQLEEKQLFSLSSAYYDNHILVVTPNDTLEVNPDVTDLPQIGVIARMKMKMDMPNGKTRVVLEGILRARVSSYHLEDQLYEATVEAVYPEKLEAKKELAYIRSLMKQLELYVNNVPYMSNAVISQITGLQDLNKVTDIVVSFFPTTLERKLLYINEIDPTKRVQMLIDDMNQDIQVMELEKKIEEKVVKELDESQKQFVLREKIKVIKEELGEGSNKEDEIEVLRKKISTLKCNPKVKDRLKLELHRYEMANPNSPEVGIIRDYIEWLLHLPWCYHTKDNPDLTKVKHILDSTHYGLEKVKNRILEYLAVQQNTKQSRSPIICLMGPPGVGKTSLAMSIAKSLGRKFTKISVGGINDEAEIIGHRRTYIGASPGRIIQGMRKAGSSNPVFIIDEIDKMTKDIKGDPASCLLEVLDPEQNSHFSDHYIEEDFDLSKVMFIATANYQEQIPEELKDRLEMIEISSYTEYEKLDIATNYIIPKQLEEHGLTELQVQFQKEAILMLIRHYTKEAGVRDLERVIASILRKIVKNLLLNKEIAFYEVDVVLVEKLLGKKKYHYMEKENDQNIGLVNGMAYTVFGGDILPIEATYYKGTGNLILTGSLGEVMKESAHIAFSYVKSRAEEFDIDSHILNENDIHIHVPEGAVNKEGPSAGITLTTTLISLFKQAPVASTIAMTGEITLRGKILPIGGLKEKLIGAHRSGIKEVYLPLESEPDLDEVPKEIINDLTIHLVTDYEEIYEQLFNKKEVRV